MAPLGHLSIGDLKKETGKEHRVREIKLEPPLPLSCVSREKGIR